MSFCIKRVVTYSQHSFSHRSSPSPISGIPLDFFDRDLSDERNCFTIILGRNAIGKSQLLSDIAEAFCIESGEFTSRRSSSLEISITTFKDKRLKDFYIGSNGDKLDQSLEARDMPSRVVASATTPFDKFRLSKDVIRERGIYREDEDWQRKQYYFYSGLRDSNGRTNFRAAILRTIRGIFLETSRSSDRLRKVRHVFDFLGLHPTVQVSYSMGGMSWANHVIEQILSKKSLDDVFVNEKNNLNYRRLVNFIKYDADNEARLRNAVLNISEHFNLPTIDKFEIEMGHSGDGAEFLNGLFLLKDLRLLTFREVSLRRVNDGNSMDILDASSGEISIISGILGIAAGIQDNALVLIDEPEISLHPEWQDRYLKLLRDTFSAFRGCHFVIATHSPIILSDANSEDTKILNLSHILDGSVSMATSIAKSYDEIVATQFGVVDDDNLYIKQEVVKAVNAIARGEVDTLDFKKRIKLLLSFRAGLGVNSKVLKIINDVVEALK